MKPRLSCMSQSLLLGMLSLTLMAAILLTSGSAARVVTVGFEGCDFFSIQDAIDEAEPGDLLEVQSGNFKEQLRIYKPLKIQGRDTGMGFPLVNSPLPGDLAEITSSEVVLEDMIFQGAEDWAASGVLVTAPGVKLINVTSRGNSVGIRLSSGDNLVQDCIIAENSLAGLVVAGWGDNCISGNQVLKNNQVGIMVMNSSGNILEGNNASLNFGVGVKVFRSRDNLVKDNLALTNDYGVVLSETTSTKVTGNQVINNDYGIYPYRSWENMIDNNTGHANDFALYLYESSNNTVQDNRLFDNDAYGILLFYSTGNLMQRNDLSENLKGAMSLRSSRDNQVLENNLSSSPEGRGLELFMSSGNLIQGNLALENTEEGFYLVDASANRLSGNKVAGSPTALLLLSGLENIITDNTLEAVDDGIVLQDGSSNRLEENVLSDCRRVGIYLKGTSYDRIRGNQIMGGRDAVWLEDVQGINLSFNNISLAATGVRISRSRENVLVGNGVNRSKTGIMVTDGQEDQLIGNRLTDIQDGLEFLKCTQSDLSMNSVNARDSGITLIRCSQMSISENTIWGSLNGLLFIYSSQNLAKKNEILENQIGINLDEGMYPENSSGNLFYLNDLLDNYQDVRSYISTNTWNNTEPMRYRYGGLIWEGYLGNFWSEVRGEDRDGDGIMDQVVDVGSQEDQEPLMDRWRKYEIMG